MAMIKCPECGKEISDKAKACIHCGYPLDVLGDDIVVDAMTDAKPISRCDNNSKKNVQASSKKSISEKLAIIVIIGLLLFVGGCFLFSAMFTVSYELVDDVDIAATVDVILTDSNIHQSSWNEDYYEFGFTLENLTDDTLTYAWLYCSILDEENTILGSATANVLTNVSAGQKAVLDGSFYLSHYPNAKSIRPDYIRLEKNDSGDLYDQYFSVEELDDTEIIINNPASEQETVDVKAQTQKSQNTKKNTAGEAEQAYNSMLSLTKADLGKTSSGARYTYRGLTLRDEDVGTIGSTFYIDQGAMYDAVAKTLQLECEEDGFLYGNIKDDYFEVLLGTEKPATWEAFKPKAQKLYKFIVPDASEKVVLKAFEKLDCVDGTFNYNTRSYDFTISDVQTAADELGISDEMLGYTLAYLSEFAADIEFNGNKVTVSLDV